MEQLLVVKSQNRLGRNWSVGWALGGGLNWSPYRSSNREPAQDNPILHYLGNISTLERDPNAARCLQRREGGTTAAGGSCG